MANKKRSLCTLTFHYQEEQHLVVQTECHLKHRSEANAVKFRQLGSLIDNNLRFMIFLVVDGEITTNNYSPSGYVKI